MSVTPFNVPIVPKLKRETFISLLKKGVRLDKRRFNQFRPISIEYGVASKAHGSALVSIGNTKVLVGIKIEPGRPFPDLPEEGVLNVNAELVPLASPEFEPGPPDENAIELARVVDRALRETPVLDTSQLVLIPGEKVWVVWVDIYVLDHDGNLFDASMLASMAALLDAKIPEHEVREDGTVEITGPPTYPLPILNKVVSVTLGVVEDSFIVDPNLEEENIIDGKVFFAFDEEGNVVGIQKSGPAWIDYKKVQVGFNIARSLYQHPLKVLASSREKGSVKESS